MAAQILVLLVAFSAGAFILVRQKTPQLPVPSASIRTNPTVMPSPTTSEVHAPDGSVTLISRAIKNADKTTTYMFTAAGRKILTKTVGLGVTLTIPANTWAPEHRYVFLEETDATSVKRFYVVATNGEPFPGGKEYLDVTALFAEKKTGFMFREATGWASPTLLIFTTNRDGQTRGPSYWFEIPSGAFLQLTR